MSDPLFQPFRALGYITDSVPFAVQRRGKETWVAVSVGKSWQIYNCAKLTLVLVGPQFKSKITALACKGEVTYAATGQSIVVCKRVHKAATWNAHSAAIVQLLLFGEFLLSLDQSGALVVWKLNSDQEALPVKTIQLPEGFQPTSMAHPPTYLNKVVVGSACGRLLLLNINSEEVLYEFEGWGSGVRCVAASPALDVIGVGLADGRAILHNVRFDETLMAFDNASGVGAGTEGLLGGGAGGASHVGGGACTTLSFKCGNSTYAPALAPLQDADRWVKALECIPGAGEPLMAAGGGTGVVTVWNLKEQSLHTVIKDAHGGALSHLHFFAGEPVLMSSAADNSLKHWIFDNADGFYGEEGTTLLTAAEDRAVRAFSVIQDQQSRELSQQHTKSRAKRLRIRESDLKLPPVVSLSASSMRERDWSNVLTASSGDPTVYTWELAKYRLGDQELMLPPRELLNGQPAAPATAVCVSHCGNFGFVATASGRLDRYNMQSGIHRGHYSRPGADSAAPRLLAHESAIIGLGCDSRNRVMVSADHKGTIRSWNFKTGALNCTLCMDCQISHFDMHAHSMLAAVTCSDLSVRVVDVDQGCVVRRFVGHADRLTAICISADSRWVVSAALDGTVRVWDIPASCCLQAMRLGTPVTALSLSPNMELLATAHVNRSGVYLWSNQMLFGSGGGVAPSTDVVDVRMPHVATGHKAGDAESEDEGAEVGDAWDSDDNDFGSDDDESAMTHVDEDEDAVAVLDAGKLAPQLAHDASGAPRPLGAELLTLSGLPASQWESLVHLDTIKARNKPTEAPVAPEAAPFFLPSMPTHQGPQLTADADAAESARVSSDPFADVSLTMSAPASEAASGSRGQVRSPARFDRVSDFQRALRAGFASGDFTSATSWLRVSSAVAVDRELRSMALLAPYDEEEVENLACLLHYLIAQLQSSQNFDHAQGLLALVLQLHGDSIADVQRLQALAAQIHRLLGGSWARIDDGMHALRCMVSFLSSMTV